MSSSKVDRPRRKRVYNVSKVKTFVRCRQQYYLRYDLPRIELDKRSELVANRPGKGLKKGTWMHALQAAYWLHKTGKGPSWEDVLEELTEEYDELFDEEKEYYGDLPTECEGLFRRYLRYYKDEDEQFQLYRMPNGKPAVEVIIEFPLDKWGIRGIYKGQIDLMVKDLEYGGVWVRDAKWVKTIPSADERMMSPQNIMYVSMLRSLGHDLRGFIYDYGRTKPPAIPYVLQSGMVTTRKNIDTDVLTYVRAIKKQHGKHWRSHARTVYKAKIQELKARETLWFDRQRMPIDGERVENGFNEFIEGCKAIVNRGAPIRSYLYNCKFNCDYHELCVARFQGLDTEHLLKSQFHIEPPRYDRELEEVN